MNSQRPLRLRVRCSLASIGRLGRLGAADLGGLDGDLESLEEDLVPVAGAGEARHLPAWRGRSRERAQVREGAGMHLVH